MDNSEDHNARNSDQRVAITKIDNFADLKEACTWKASDSASVPGTPDTIMGACGDRPQRNCKSPVWLGNFVFCGDFEQAHQEHSQCLSDSPTPQSLRVIAQKQLDQQPLELQDMWHLSDNEECRERQLPGANLDISWVTQETKTAVNSLLYSSTANDGQCPRSGCTYKTSSSRKLMVHVLTHFIV